MSEYQYIAFRAIDRPVSGENLEYMRRQSSRAEVTPWSFENEYHYGNFGGNAPEMLRRGYDLHLHYANFGIRALMIRLPNGLPDGKAAAAYLDTDAVRLLKDKQGPGATLLISLSIEPGELEDLREPASYVDRLVPLRGEILAGDLRPLYLAHLAICLDGDHDPDESHEGPVPAGLGELSDAQAALAEYLGLGESLIAAAASASPPLPAAHDAHANCAAWLGRQSEAAKTQWLVNLLGDSETSVRGEILAAYRKAVKVPAWPTVKPNRTIAELETLAEAAEQVAQQKAAEAAARARAKRLAQMAADPKPFLRETEKQAKERTTDAYQKIAQTLADLREALANSDRAGLAETQARKLQQSHPTLKLLVSELRKHGFLTKTQTGRAALLDK